MAQKLRWRLKDMTCTVQEWIQWVQSPVGSNLRCAGRPISRKVIQEPRISFVNVSIHNTSSLHMASVAEKFMLFSGI